MGSCLTWSGGSTYGIRVQVPVGEVIYALDRPLILVTPVAAVTPDLTVNGPAIEIRTDRWTVVEVRSPYVGGAARALPVVCADRAVAERIAVAYTDDPSVDWDTDPADQEAWCLCWTAAHDQDGDTA